MAEEDHAQDTDKVKEILKSWIAADDRERELRKQIKEIKDQKNKGAEDILKYMRDNQVDNFAIEGKGGLSRSVRSSRPALRRDTIRTQLLLQFADQPQRVADVLRAIEGAPEAAGAGRELLVRHVPREKKITLA
jgi:DNA-binding SARP family transcriptional activator